MIIPPQRQAQIKEQIDSAIVEIYEESTEYGIIIAVLHGFIH